MRLPASLQPAFLVMIAMLLASCATTGPRPQPVATPAAVAPTAAGLDRVLGRPAPALTALFGPATLDIREGKARKLQFRGPACVLDAYLYPPAAGGDVAPLTPVTPVVSWIDTRDRKGGNLDRASCIAALARGEPTKHLPPSRRGR